MNVTRCLWAVVVLCLAWESIGLAQEPPPPPLQPTPVPPAARPPVAPGPEGTLLPPPGPAVPYLRHSGPITMALDEQGFPLATGQPWSFLSPIQGYVRVGSAVVIGDRAMDNAIDAGISLEGGLRSYGYNSTRTAAWTCELGVDYTFNNATTSDVVLTVGGLTPVNRFGQTVNLPTIHRYQLLELHRTAVRATVGREWYFGIENPEGVQYSLGLDFGGRLGWAHAKLQAVSRSIQGFQAGFDTLPEFLDGHTGDQIKGLLGGGHAGILVPCNGFEWTANVRVEYGRDWFHILDDDSVESIRYMVELGLRF